MASCELGVHRFREFLLNAKKGLLWSYQRTRLGTFLQGPCDTIHFGTSSHIVDHPGVWLGPFGWISFWRTGL